MKYTKKQIIISVTAVLAAAAAWESLYISIFLTNVFWQPYWEASFQSELAGVLAAAGRNILFSGIFVFFSLIAVKYKMNALKISLAYIAGIAAAYVFHQGAASAIINNLWASGWNRTWSLPPYEGYFSGNINLLHFDTFIYWMAGCGICIFDYFKSKKIEEKERSVKNQILLFGIISGTAVFALCADIMVLYRSEIGAESIFYNWGAVFQISLLWLAYIVYTKKLPVLWFCISCIFMFLGALLLNTLISINGGFEPRRVTYVLFAANTAVNMGAMFLFFALESRSKKLIALSALCFALIPVSYVFFNITAFRSWIYGITGYIITFPAYGSAYELWFLLPLIIAFCIKDYRDIKRGRIGLFHSGV